MNQVLSEVGVLDRWLLDKQNVSSSRVVVDMFRVFAGCDGFEELLGIEDPNGVFRDWRDHLLVRGNRMSGSRGLAPGSVTAYLSHVRSFYRHFGVELGVVPRVRHRVVLPHKILTDEELGLMLRHGGIRDKALMWGLYSSGVRIRSLLCLNVGRIDFRGEAPVALRLRADETKYNVVYTTFLCEGALDALGNYVRWRKKQGEVVTPGSPLFVNKYGRRLKYASSKKSLERVREKAGVAVEDNERFAHHSFRAAFHRNLQVSGVNQYIIEKLMGHSTEQTTTGRYSIGLTPDDLREAYKKAQWSLEVDENRVRELENRLGETERQLGAERVSKSMLDKRMEAMEKQIQLMQEYVKRQG